VIQRVGRTREDDLLQPLLSDSRGFYIFGGILLILVVWFGYTWITQLTQGLGVSALRTPVGAAWGVYISNFVFFACMAHGGMAISAAVRLFKLTKYLPVARMGEVLTAIALMMAGLSIVVDMGRPDRAFNMILYWPQRVGSSPLSWDVTVIVLYFTLSASYLWLTMRKDLARCLPRFSRRGWLYRLLLIGYRSDEGGKIERMAWWLSIAIIFLIVMLSGGVIPWIFGLQPGRPGWFGALAGPYFLTAAIASSMAAVVIVAAILRRVFAWQAHLKLEIFRGLGAFMGIISLFYLYLTFAELITMEYAAPHPELLVSEMILQGELSQIYWSMLIFGFLMPSLLLIIQAIRPSLFSLTNTTLAAAILLVAFWMKRFFIVVPSLLRPLLPFQSGTYYPSWVEWSVIIGIFAMAALLYMVYLKLFPIVELSEE
jgi:molybdopterin-containing oxidoreductase family membrane subunit